MISHYVVPWRSHEEVAKDLRQPRDVRLVLARHLVVTQTTHVTHDQGHGALVGGRESGHELDYGALAKAFFQLCVNRGKKGFEMKGNVYEYTTIKWHTNLRDLTKYMGAMSMMINLFEYFRDSKTGKARKSAYKRILFEVQEPR